MKISELIDQLQALRDKHGDLPCAVSYDTRISEVRAAVIEEPVDWESQMFGEHDPYPETVVWITEANVFAHPSVRRRPRT